MKQSFVWVVVAVVLLLVGAVWLLFPKGKGIEEDKDINIVYYTLEEVAKHSSREDCWIVIHGKVYDVTSFIPEHPGGDAILQGCGKDATELFETRPMGSGTPHSEEARELLERYYIGELKE